MSQLYSNDSHIQQQGRRQKPCPSPLLYRQHPSYGDCLEVKREYYQNSSLLDCLTQCSQSAAYLYENFLQVKQIGFVTLGPLRIYYVVHRGGSRVSYIVCVCLLLRSRTMMVMVEWLWWDFSLIFDHLELVSFSAFWHCWFGHLACKNRSPNDIGLLCVEWDVKPYTHSLTPVESQWKTLNYSTPNLLGDA